MINLKDLSLNGILNLVFESYKPYINYTWSNTFQVAKQMYSKNIGNSGQDLQLFSGQGFKCNGTNQSMSAGTFSELGVGDAKSVLTIACTTSVATSGVLWNTGYSSVYSGVSLQVSEGLISLNSNSSENALLSTPYVAGQVVCTFSSNVWSIYINGVLKVSRLFIYSTPFAFSPTQVFSIGAYRLTAQYYNGIITDVYMFTDTLTTDEIALYSANPNQFFQNVQDGIIGNCVLNMPLHGIDANQYNYANQTAYQVINYTADCVTLAKQLPYGSQEANFFHTSSGVPIRTGLSPFFESTPYWNNYGDTGWICSGEKDWAIDFVGLFQTKALEQSHGVAYSTRNNRIALGVTALGIPFARCGGNIVNFSTLSKFDTLLNLVLVYKSTAKTFELYMNGVYAAAHTNINFIGSDNPFYLGSLGINTYKVDGVVRLFKVHTKALTREDITKNFNEYTAKGLLANFLLDENGNYIKDESNNYIMT